MIRNILTVLALAAGLATPAFATASHDITTQDVYFNTLTPSTGLNTSGPFSVGFSTEGSFDEVFQFLVPPTSSTSQVSFFGFADFTVAGTSSVAISSIDFGVFNYFNYAADTGGFLGANVTSLPLGSSLVLPFAFGGVSQDYLGSGIYYIEVKGAALVADAGFYGVINTTAIPEPANAVLLLAGLGVMGTLARRRKQAA